MNIDTSSKVDYKDIVKIRTKLKKISHSYMADLSDITGHHRNTIGNVFNDKAGVNENTRLIVLKAAAQYIKDFKYKEQDVLKEIKNATN